MAGRPRIIARSFGEFILISVAELETYILSYAYIQFRRQSAGSSGRSAKANVNSGGVFFAAAPQRPGTKKFWLYVRMTNTEHLACRTIVLALEPIR